jgi:excisionase family DNA binding protein
VSVPEAAIRAGVSRAFFFELIRRGEVPTVKLGRRRLVRIEALRSWLKGLEARS